MAPTVSREGSDSDNLPSLMDICLATVPTREYLEPAILVILEPELLRCINQLLECNAVETVSVDDSSADRPEWRRCRIAWQELFMLCKTCIPQLPGGQKKYRRNLNIIVSRLERWRAGERRTLWDELPSLVRRSGAKAASSPEQDMKLRQERAMAYTMHGMPGKAVSRLTGPPLAPDTPTTESAMRSKFADPPEHQASRQRRAPTANVLTEKAVAKTILSFHPGVGGGPSGLRPDVLKQIIGKKGNRPGIAPITAFCNLLADGQAPPYVQPYLAGANGFALAKESKMAQAEAVEAAQSSVSPQTREDVRPVCSGEVWRRVTGKALLESEKDALLDYLLPYQLAVAVRSGTEVMPHLARAWMEVYKDDASRVLVDYDESNAHNTVDRVAFLDRMCAVAPGAARWLEFIYPTASPTYVFYNGKCIESRAGGQQGCPLMGACHAVVQRSLLEALGMLPLAPGTQALLPTLEPPAILDMTPMFADDGFFAGPADEVQRALAHLVSVLPRLGLTFSKLDVFPAAGSNSILDETAFTRLGCKVFYTANPAIMKIPIGDVVQCESYLAKRVEKGASIAQQISKLPDAHCAVQLLRYQTSRMEYTTRACPQDLGKRSLRQFDSSIRSCFERIVGFGCSDTEWKQATLPSRYGGWGFRACLFHSDAAYLASRSSTEGLCKAIWPGFNTTTGGFVQAAIHRLNAQVSPGEQLDGSVNLENVPEQRALSDGISKACFENLKAESGAYDQARLNAFASPGVNRWLQEPPSKTLDKHFSGYELITSIQLSLGVDVNEGSLLCRFCATPLDTKGIHPSSCSAGGDCNLRHNETRDKLFKWAQRARLNPVLEKAGIFNENDVICLRRPADVLVDDPVTRIEKVALDIKVINSLGPGHIEATMHSSSAAADAYRVQALEHQDTARRCLERGIRYEPLVFTAQGGMQSRTESFITQFATAIAKNESLEPGSIKADIIQDLSRGLARAAARAIARRTKRTENDFCSLRYRMEAETLED